VRRAFADELGYIFIGRPTYLYDRTHKRVVFFALRKGDQVQQLSAFILWQYRRERWKLKIQFRESSPDLYYWKRVREIASRFGIGIDTEPLAPRYSGEEQGYVRFVGRPRTRVIWNELLGKRQLKNVLPYLQP
jgi:hypothetical protein